MERGRVWVEAYLPFDPEAYRAFARLAATLGPGVDGYRLAAEQDPDLASRALTPIDSHGEAMLAEDLEQLADAFMLQSRRIDVQHDNETRKTAHVVGSFVNTPEIGSPNFWPGAWVVVLAIDPGSPEFEQIKAGQLNAVSFQAIVTAIGVYYGGE